MSILNIFGVLYFVFLRLLFPLFFFNSRRNWERYKVAKKEAKLVVMVANTSVFEYLYKNSSANAGNGSCISSPRQEKRGPQPGPSEVH